MHNRLILAGLAATGGLLTTAFLQTAVAVADTAGADAFTIGGYTFDPQLAGGGEGFDQVATLTSSPPLLELGGGTALGLPLASQDFNVYDPSSGTELGSIQGNETILSLFGLTNAEFTVASDSPADGATTALPSVNSVYDVFNLGNGYENVYVATPDVTVDGVTTPGTVTDTFVTPSGNTDLSSLFDFNAANPLNPGDAFTGLDASGITGAPDAFSIGGLTLDPISAAGGEGFDTIAPLATAAPFLEIGGSSLGDPATGGNDLATQSFDVYSGTGSSAAEIGTINTGVDVTNLFGLTNTQLIVTGVTPDGADTTGLPAVGSIYDATNLGNGYENVYTAVPGADGPVTDTLVTPYGNINLDSLFGSVNYANPLEPGDALTGLQAGDSAIGADAFSLGGFTFDPTLVSGAEGFTPVEQLVGAPPLLDLGGGTPTIFGATLSLAEQNFNIYDGSTAADQIGSITTNDQVTNLLGLVNTEFTVTGHSLLPDAPAGAELPTDGSVYDVLNIGGGIENIYTAIPGVDSAAAQISDILATPFGNVDLSDLFGGIDATSLLNPGDAFDALTSGLAEAGAGAATAIDPLAFLGL
ncbi:hypothetical protein [Mycobacterium sp.]|uniref:hypothetical protein n=1 Tax=Mycobacterium sp. TaxID=1785 RepID=UPI003D0B8FEE